MNLTIKDPALSAEAVQISHEGAEVIVINRSETHVIYLEDQATRAIERLEPAGRSTGASRPAHLTNGHFELRTPTSANAGYALSIVIQPDVDSTLPSASASGDDDDDPTFVGVNLNQGTKEFLAALLLCRSKLEINIDARTPTIPELAKQMLITTSSILLLEKFENDESFNKNLRWSVEAQLKSVRAKLVKKNLSVPDALDPALAKKLIDTGVIRSSHLKLLDDDAWLTAQEDLWWGNEAE